MPDALTPEQQLDAALNGAVTDAQLVDACYAYIAEASSWNLAGVIAGSFAW